MPTRRLVLAAAVVSLAAVAWADDDQDPRQSDDPTPQATTTARLEEVVVEARKPLSAASSEEVRARDYELRPHATTQEILNDLPGVIVAQHQGGGKATQYLVRGFDADHGTDFAVFVDDLPVNLPTHAHGQGYADLNFLIPETVDRLNLYKGPFFPQFGDFATAGALNLVTRDEFKEHFFRAEGGSFDTQRYAAGVSPHLGEGKTLLAAQAYYSNGPFDHPQHYNRYNAFGKYTLDLSPASTLSTSVGLYQGSWRGSGQIPLREVSAGRLDRFGAIDPTEGGRTDRENLNLRYTYRPSATEEWWFQLYASRYKLALFSDFTFYKDTGLRFLGHSAGSDQCPPDAPPDLCRGPTPSLHDIPGDGIEQNDQRYLYGARARYTRFWTLGAFPTESRLQVETRNDQIHVALYRQVERHRFFTVNRLAVDERSTSGFLEQQVFFTDWIRADVGLRGDVYFLHGFDDLPVQPFDPNFDPVRIRGRTTDGMVSPKANLILTPAANTDVFFNFGTGFHSNDARNALLARANPRAAGGLQSPLTRAIGYEIGSRTRQLDNRLDLAAALWWIDLDSELVFSGDVGTQETAAGGNFRPARASRRYGVDVESLFRVTRRLTADYDLSYADPRFRNGDAIPLAPTLLMNGGLTLDLGHGLSTALRLRFLDDRPAIEDRSLIARGYTLLDLIARWRWRNVEASLALLNLTDTDWREAQFADTSCVRREVVPGGFPPKGNPGRNGFRFPCVAQPGKQTDHPLEPAPDIHFTPGNPLGVRAGITVFF